MKMTVRINPATMAPIEIRLLTTLLRKVKSVITAVDASGRNKTHQISDRYSILISAKASELHGRQIFHMGGLATAIERDDQRQANGHFGRSDRDDKEHEHLAIELVVEA